MKILILGGTRFVGKLLVNRLLENGYDVTLLTRGNTKDIFENRVKKLYVSRSDKIAMKRCLDKKEFDIVYDNICFNAKDAKITCEIFNKTKIKKYIFISSMYVYNEQKEPLIESDFNPYSYSIGFNIRSIFDYAEGKRLAERYFARWANFDTLFVRFPIIMARDDYTKRFENCILNILKNKPIYISYPQGKMNYISSYDAANFLYWLKDIDIVGAINAASKESFSANELINEFSKVLDKKAIIQRSDHADKLSPYYRKANMVIDTTKAENLGYKFSSFYTWFANEVNACAKQYFNSLAS